MGSYLIFFMHDILLRFVDAGTVVTIVNFFLEMQQWRLISIGYYCSLEY